MEGQSSSHQEYKISGHTVLFPCKPYPSQFSMMDRIIRGIERHQNCLLESPTGSGKTLALLCSALAWQTSEKRKIEMENEAICSDCNPESCQCSCHTAQPEPSSHHQSATTATATVTASAAAVVAEASGAEASGTAGSSGTAGCAAVVVSEDPGETGKTVLLDQTSGANGDVTVIDDDSDEDFRPLKKFREPGKSNMVTRKKKARVSIKYEDTPPSSPFPSPSTSAATDNVAGKQAATPDGKVSPGPSGVGGKTGRPSSTATPCSQCSCGSTGAPTRKPKKLPKIFFGTRTHKQVAQIVRELRKTAYHDVPMTILASREHTCIHPKVSNSANKNEGCEELMKDVGCRFKDRVIKFQTQEAIKGMGLDTAWDLEDLVTMLKKKKACPYFLSRGLKEQADLIICPYNYLVDPLIREAMEINLKGQIVLLDEAHNIEDSIREAASQKITQEQIQKALTDMEGLIDKGEKVADLSKLRQMCHKLDMFIENKSGSLIQHDFEQSYTMWSGFDIIAQLNTLDLGLQKMEQLTAAIASIKAAEQEEKLHAGGGDVTTLSTATWTLLEQVFLVLKYLYKDNMKHAEDYRMAIVKSIQYVALNPNGSWLNSRRHFGRKTPVEVFTLNFWCMSPAVGFADFGSCRSVILTSGTLSPMDTFQSELGQPFPILLEANHVIKDSQVWVGAVGQGPDGTSLQAVYRNMESFQFQDSLGHLILSICQKVPKGILCFLPSYKTLEKLTNRWKATGLWERMAGYKQLMCEPRRSDNIDFEQIIRGYYNVIHCCEDSGENLGVDGALFFAVFRGKVSEGLDFADNFARAVITVGIPYPNFKDLQVELKRKYNDKYQASRGLLSGSLWYEIQAFRALNQALGRCIRHRNDWGALIIVDDRFIKNTLKYSNGLSKWVRQKFKVHPQCTSMLASLSEFTQNRLQAQELDDSLNASQLPSTPHTSASSQTTPPSFTSPPPSFTSPPLPSPDLHLADSRAPLHDVSNVAATAASTAPFPVVPTVASSQVQHQSVPHLSSKTESANGEQTVAQIGESSSTLNSLPSEIAVSQACATVVATTLPGRTGQNTVGGKQCIIKGPPEILNDPKQLEQEMKSQGIQHFTVVDQPPQPQEQNQSPAVSVLSKTASHITPSTSAKASPGQTVRPVSSAGQAVRPVSLGQAVRPTTTVTSLGQAAASKSSPDIMLLNGTVHPGISAALSLKLASGPGSVSKSASAVRQSSVTPASGSVSKSASAVRQCSVTPASGSVSKSASAVGQSSVTSVPGLRDVPNSANAPRMVAAAHKPGVAGRVPGNPTLVGNSVLGAVSTLRPGAGRVITPITQNGWMFLPVKDPSFQPMKLVVKQSASQTKFFLPDCLASAVGGPLVVVSPGIGEVILAPTLQQALLLAPSSTQSLPPFPRLQPGSGGTVKHCCDQTVLSVSSGSVTSIASPGVTTTSALQKSIGSGSATGEASPTTTCPALQKSIKITAVKQEPNDSNQASSAGVSLLFPSPGAALRRSSSRRASSKVGEMTSVSSTAASKVLRVSSSQTSEGASSSPSLFDDSPKSASPAVRKMIPVQAKATSPTSGNGASIPEGIMTTASSDLQKTLSPAMTVTSTAGNGNSSVVASPSVPRSLVQTGDAPGSTKTSLEADSKAPPSSSISEEGGIRTLPRKRLFRKAARKSSNGTCSHQTPHPQQSAEGASSERDDCEVDNRGKKDAWNRGERDAWFAGRSDADDSADMAEQGEGVEEKVERRVRGAKRRTLSLGGSSKRKRSDDLLDNITQEKTSGMKCAACHFLLLQGIKDFDFERRDNMPTCLKGMLDATHPEVLYFKGTTVTERFKLPPSAEGNCRRQQNSDGVEATVELIHCPGCTTPGQHLSTASTLLGAKVTLTDPAAKVSTGQMWIFAHRVTMSATGASA